MKKILLTLVLFIPFGVVAQQADIDPLLSTDGNVVLPDDTISLEIPAAQPEQDETVDGSIIPSAPAGYQSFDGENFDTLNSDVLSLFYTREQIDFLYSQISRFKKSGGKVASLVNQAEQLVSGSTVSEESLEVNIVTYYLGLILYPSDKNWSLWLNGNKIRKEQNGSDPMLEVAEVGDKAAVFNYKVARLEIDSPFYRTKLKSVGEHNRPADKSHNWDLVSEDGLIKLSSSEKIVQFRLKLNQTFSLYDMEIKEGDYKPIVKDAATIAAEQGMNDITAEQNDALTAPETTTEQQNIDMLQQEQPEASVPAAAPPVAEPVRAAAPPPASLTPATRTRNRLRTGI